MAAKEKFKLQIPDSVFDTVYGMPLWQKILILVISWVIPLALFWLFFMSIRLGELSGISERIPKLKQEVNILEIKRQQIPKLEKEVEAMQKILKQAMKLLPEKEDIPSVLTAISSIGNEARLEFQAFRPGREKIHDFYASIPVSLEFKGPFHNTVVFFDRVSRMPRIVHIKDVSMGGATESSQIWSQVAGEKSGQPVGGQAGGAGPSQGGSEGGEVVQRGGTWVIKTKCTAVTYRFLTPEEQERYKQLKKKKKKKK